MDRRGISAIVATVLTILITVAGVAIVWVAIVPMISESLEFDALVGRVSIVSTEGYTLYDANREVAIVQIKRDVDEGVMDRIKISFIIGGNSVSSNVVAPESGQIKTYSFDLLGYGEPESVGVAPIFVSGSGSEKEGSISSVKMAKSVISEIKGVVYGIERDYSNEFVVQVKTTESNELHYDIDDFEDGGDIWNSRNGVTPVITSSAAYTGSYSLYMSSSWGRNFEVGNNIEAGQTSLGYNTKDYPYMCMAYKIPATTRNNMLINVDGVSWKSVTMTLCENPTSYPKIASWNPLVADNSWHYTCINLDEQLDASLGPGDHIVRSIIWHDGYGCTGVNGEFWIDDFVITKNPYLIG